jgi:hypothetical protein
MRRLGAAILCVILLAGVGGCAEVDRRRDAEAYQQRANEKFAEHDIRERVWREARSRHPEVRELWRRAMVGQNNIVGAKFLGSVKYYRPTGWTKVWVTLLISREGRIDFAGCTPDDQAAGLNPAHEQLILAAVKQWTFSPATIDGEAVPALNVFPAFTNGTEFCVSEPRELQ